MCGTSYHTFATHSTAPVGKACLEPERESGIGLEVKPSPGDLDGHGAHQRTSGLGDSLVEGFVATLVGSGGEPAEGCELATVLNVPPGEELEGEEPGRL